jgi:hypothetical protein
MVICGSYMFEFSVSKDMKKKTMMKGEFHISSNTNCQKIENQCWVGKGGNNFKYNQTLNIIFSVTH